MLQIVREARIFNSSCGGTLKVNWKKLFITALAAFFVATLAAIALREWRLSAGPAALPSNTLPENTSTIQKQ